MVSVANVSQLAADLLIATLGLEQIGIFDAKDLIPVVGAREDEAPGVTTPLERVFLLLQSRCFSNIRP